MWFTRPGLVACGPLQMGRICPPSKVTHKGMPSSPGLGRHSWAQGLSMKRLIINADFAGLWRLLHVSSLRVFVLAPPGQVYS